LTHEAVIDKAWQGQILPQLRARYPKASADDLAAARAFAYGGCIIQDIGYFPFGSKFFSDLLHYVRTGDFVMNEIEEAQDLNEYAFALGSLAHYAADNEGHADAVNPAVGAEYPKLEREFGRHVTYEDNPKAHLRVEFSFDVLQVARGSYVSQQYHDLIGFGVSKDLVGRAFRKTYGLEITDVFPDLDQSIATYRYAVRSLIPDLTKQAWHWDRDDLLKSTPGITRTKFVYTISRRSYEKEWDHHYRQPSLFIRFLGVLVRVLPKVGPLKVLAFQQPTRQTETWFVQSFDNTEVRYARLLAQASHGDLQLVNTNLDTGEIVKPAAYRLADQTFARLAIRLAESRNGAQDPRLRAELVSYFADERLPFADKVDKKEWAKLQTALESLRAAPPAP
jgi:hypothetical protein